MREELKENIKLSAQSFVPFWVSFVFILFNYIPASVGYPNIIRPEIGIISVFYWVLYRPDLFNMFTVFFLGVISDVLSVIPLGTNTMAYLMVYLAVNNMRSFFNNKPFNIIWFGFVFVFLMAEFAKWLIVSVYYTNFIPLENLFFTILFTVACYPVISFVNELARKYLMNDEG